MPIYEYQCEGCAHQFETIQKVSEPLLTQCPECGDDSLKKLVSAAAFRLKGSGWYETDFKSGTKKNVAESASDSGTSDSGTSESRSEASEGDSSGGDSSGGDSRDSSPSGGSDKPAKKSESKTKGNDDKAA